MLAAVGADSHPQTRIAHRRADRRTVVTCPSIGLDERRSASRCVLGSFAMSQGKSRGLAAVLLVFLAWLGACSDAEEAGPGASQQGAREIDDPLNAASETCVQRINDFRETLGLPAYERWSGQEACADEQARSDSMTGKDHGEFGACGEFAQNECPQWRSIDETIDVCLQMMWDEGPPPSMPCEDECYKRHGHFLAMSSTRYTEVACGFYETPDGEVWAIHNFR